MENKKIIFSLGIIGIIILALLFFFFFNQNPTITQTQIFENNDIQITKTINIQNTRTEEYEINITNPIIGFLIIPETITTNTNQININGDFTTQTTKNPTIIKIESKEYTPGKKILKINLPIGENEQTSILLTIPLKEYNSFSEIEKTEIEQLVKEIAKLDKNYFTFEETKKIMQEYLNPKITLQQTTNPKKISFSNNNQKIKLTEPNPYTTTLKQILEIRNQENTNTPTNPNINEQPKLNLTENEYFQNLSKNLNKILTNRNQNNTQENQTNDYTITINFQPETKQLTKIIIPYSKENPIITWNGEITIETQTTTELKFQTNNNAVQFEYILNPNQENQNKKKYTISIIINTRQLTLPITKINTTIQANEFMGKQIPLDITLIENPCETRINQYTEFENDYHTEYLTQLELYKATTCITNITTINLQNLQKPDQNWIGREEQLSSKILTEIFFEKKEAEEIRKIQEQQKINYSTDFKKAQQILEDEIKPTIIEAKNNIIKAEEYLYLIEDKNAIDILENTLLYLKIILEEKNLLLDPTDHNAFKRKTESEIEFYLKSNQINTTDPQNTEKIQELKNAIYANNYNQHGTWDPTTIFLEISNAKYSIEQELNGAMKELAKKIISDLGVKEKYELNETFDPYHKNFNTPKNKTLRETILYIGISNKYTPQEKAIEKLQQTATNHPYSINNTTQFWKFKIENDYSLQINRINNLFEEYLGLKLLLQLTDGVNEIQEKMEQKHGLTKTDINYYPIELNLQAKEKNKTLQEIFLADETTIQNWLFNEKKENTKTNQNQYAREQIQSAFFGKLKQKITTIEHFKFRTIIENISQAEKLASQIEIFDNTAAQEYQKIIKLKQEENKLTNWNYFLTNLLKPFALEETRSEIKFKIKALQGIKQIQMLLLDGYNLQQIEQKNINWEQKNDFDTQQKNLDSKKVYETAKTSGPETAIILNSTLTNSNQLISLEGAIDELYEKENSDNLQLALLITPIRNEFKKTYKIEANKLLNKEKLEKINDPQEIEELILPESYHVGLLLENADYYYNESLYENAHYLYQDITLFYPKTYAAEKAMDQMKKFSTWRMYYSKPYWETFETLGTEFLTVKNIAKYIAYGTIIKYGIVPAITKASAVSYVQKAYALETIEPLTATKNLSLMTSTQSKIFAITNKLKPIGNTLSNINTKMWVGAINTVKKIGNSKTWKILTYDLTGGDIAYKQWLQEIARNTVIKEQTIITSQFETLKKLSQTATPNLNQLDQLQTTLSTLNQHNVIPTQSFESFEYVIGLRKTQIINEQSLKEGIGIIIDAEIIPETTTLTSCATSQVAPISAANITKLAQVESVGLGNNIPILTTLKNCELPINQSNEEYFFELKKRIAEENIEMYKEGLAAAKTSNGYVANSFIKYLEDRLKNAILELDELQEIPVDSINIACSLCTAKVKSGLDEINLETGFSIVINPTKSFEISSATIEGLPATVRVQQIVLPNLELASATLTKTNPTTILLKIYTPKIINIISPINSPTQIIQEQAFLENITNPNQTTPNIEIINSIIFDKSAGQSWIESFSNPMEKQIANNILNNLKVNSVPEFELATKQTAENISTALGDEPSAFLFDFDTGKSKRWLFETHNQYLKKQPNYATYFSKNHHTKIIDELSNSGINTFVIWDDATYSGDDAVTRFIDVINSKYVGKEVKPKIIVAYSYYTDTAKKAITSNENVIFIGTKRMTTVSEILTPEQKTFLAGRSLLSDGTEVLTGLSTETMPYKIPDDHSLVAANKLMEKKVLVGEPVYKDITTTYFQNEKTQFGEYFENGPKNLIETPISEIKINNLNSNQIINLSKNSIVPNTECIVGCSVQTQTNQITKINETGILAKQTANNVAVDMSRVESIELDLADFEPIFLDNKEKMMLFDEIQGTTKGLSLSSQEAITQTISKYKIGTINYSNAILEISQQIPNNSYLRTPDVIAKKIMYKFSQNENAALVFSNKEGIFYLSDGLKIGRESSNDLILDSVKISRAQAKISFDGKSTFLENIGNGKIKLNENIITERTMLNEGDVVSFGEDSDVFQISSPKKYILRGKGIELEIGPNSGVARIGRNSDQYNKNVISTSDPRSSKRHAYVYYSRSKGELIVVDRGSKSGTFLNGKPLITNGSAILEDGDIIRVASEEIVVLTKSTSNPIKIESINQIIPKELLPETVPEEKIDFMTQEEFLIFRNLKGSLCTSRGCYSPTTKRITIPVDNPYYLDNGQINVTKVKATLKHEKTHRAWDFGDPVKKEQIIQKILTDPAWPERKRQFLIFWPQYATNPDKTIVNEMIARVVGYQIFPSQHDAPMDVMNTQIKPIVTEEVIAFLNEGDYRFKQGLASAGGEDIALGDFKYEPFLESLDDYPALVESEELEVELSFSRDPSIWDNGAQVKIIENFSKLKLTGDFSKIGGVRVIGYDSAQVSLNGIVYALKNVPALEPKYIIQIEEAMKQNKRIFAIEQKLHGDNVIYFYFPKNSMVTSSDLADFAMDELSQYRNNLTLDKTKEIISKYNLTTPDKERIIYWVDKSIEYNNQDIDRFFANGMDSTNVATWKKTSSLFGGTKYTSPTGQELTSQEAMDLAWKNKEMLRPLQNYKTQLEKIKANLIEDIVNTTQKNPAIIKSGFREIGMKKLVSGNKKDPLLQLNQFDNMSDKLKSIDQTLANKPTKVKVLCISQKNYDDPNLNLAFSDNDSKVMINYFLNQGIPQENILGITDPTKETFLTNLKNITQTIKSDETLILFYAGHTYTESGLFSGELKNNFYFAPKNTIPPNEINFFNSTKITDFGSEDLAQHVQKISDARNIIPINEVGNILQTMQGNIVFIADSCYSGNTCEILSTQLDNGIFIGSTKTGELAVEKEELQNGVWTAIFKDPHIIRTKSFTDRYSAFSIDPITNKKISYYDATMEYFDPNIVNLFSERIIFASKSVGLGSAYNEQTAGTIISKSTD